MLVFDEGTFSTEYSTEEGSQLWVLLSDEESAIRFDAATYLKKPALQALEERILQEFRNSKNIVRSDRYKQMMGRMTRQIMESRGYVLDRSGVVIKDGKLFKSAARYKKYDG